MKNPALLIGSAIVVGLLLIIGIVFIFVGGNSDKERDQEQFQDPLANATEIKSVWKSSDGGRTFSPSSKVIDADGVKEADIVSIAFHPDASGYVVVGSVEDGLFKTEDAGKSWSRISFPPQQIYSFILDSNDPDERMFASGVVGDTAKIFRTDDAGETWRAVYTEPGSRTVITSLAQHPSNRNTIFAGTNSGTVIKSSDGGETWKNVGMVVQGNTVDISFDANKSSVMYLLTLGKEILYSSDAGLHWINWEDQKDVEEDALRDRITLLSRADRDVEADALRAQAKILSDRNQKNRMPSGITTLVADPNRSGTVYAGTRDGLFRSTDHGKYWYELNIIESAREFDIDSIAINPENSNEIVFVAGNSFHKSTNNGETWAVTAIDSEREASFVAYNPFDTEQIYIGVSED